MYVGAARSHLRYAYALPDCDPLKVATRAIARQRAGNPPLMVRCYSIVNERWPHARAAGKWCGLCGLSPRTSLLAASKQHVALTCEHVSQRFAAV
jgi:hypothetical protein